MRLITVVLAASALGAAFGVVLLQSDRVADEAPGVEHAASIDAPAKRPAAPPDRSSEAPRAPAPSARPTSPPRPGVDQPRSIPQPTVPPNARQVGLEAFVKAVQAHAARPGETAFRAMASTFVRHNQALAEQQAAAEGLTLEEVEELTYFGLMAQESQRWGEVEELVGETIAPNVRAAGEALLNDLNEEFKARMRALVRQGAGPEARWALIQETQATYRRRYYALTGMSAGLLDSLLAGDAARQYAAGTTARPADTPKAEPTPEPEDRPEASPDEPEPAAD